MNTNSWPSSWRQIGIIGLTLIAFLLLARWGGSADATDNNFNETIAVDPRLLTEIAENGQAGYLLYFADKADLDPAYDMAWDARGHYVVNALRQTAEASQKNVRAYLDSQGVVYQHFWIDNIVVVESSDMTVFNGLLSFAEIAHVQAKTDMILFEPGYDELEDDALSHLLAPEPNLVQVNAPDVWDLGFRGQGTVVANIDSGVRYTHEALVNQYRGNLGGGLFDHHYNWLDPSGDAPAPSDGNGHGTHVMGIMVGYNGGANEIGVAPDAEWIACRACLGSSCFPAALLACAQWVAAPHPMGDPDSPDPSRRPFVVNNSWGDCQQAYHGWYQGVVDAWHAAGVYPVFANGNAGNCGYSTPPGLNTVGNPARYGNVTGVGSSGNSNGQYASHSNWGPTDNPDTINPQPGWADLKPQFVAPGVSIRSSVASGNGAYQSSTGTSMSAPHVTGLIALIWQAAPCLIGEYAATERLIEQTATPILYNDLGSGARWPNYATGWGEINALAAVTAAVNGCQATGIISGTAADSVSGDPLPGVAIVAQSDTAALDLRQTDAVGTYRFDYAPAGFYTVTATLYGYLTAVAANIEVITGTTTTQNFSLTPAPIAVISGAVTDINTGWPIYAQIAVDGVPGSPFWTDPATGAYQIALPQDGRAYTMTVASFASGYIAETRALGPLSGDLTENFQLDIDIVACAAPGYYLYYYYYEDFEANNGGYSVVGPTPAPWQWGQPVTWPGRCAEGNNCWGTNLTGSYNNNAEERLVSPVIQLTHVPTGTRLLARWYQANSIAPSDQADAQIRFHGDSWQTVWQLPGPISVIEDWREMVYDISANAGGDVRFRWRLVSAPSLNFAGFYVDRVAITECRPAEGGFVIGHVYDANSGSPLLGAVIAGDDRSALTVATPDPDVDDALFILFAAPGEVEITAAKPGGYVTQTAILDIQENAIISHNFWLPAGHLTFDPEVIEVSLAADSQFVLPIAIANEGTAGVDYALRTDYLLYEDFEGDFPPEGWTVVNYGGVCVWQRNDAWPRPNYAGGDGFAAAADADACGPGTTTNTQLRLPPLDLSGVTTATLHFVASYNHFSSNFRVRVSSDGGNSWETLLNWTDSVHPNGPGSPVALDLSSFAGLDNVLLAFHYIRNGSFSWAQVDQVQVVVNESDWLSLSTTKGSLAAGEAATVEATLDATGLTPGVYQTTLFAFNETPYGIQTLPVRLTVVETAVYGLQMSPQTAATFGEAGEVVSYTLTLTNTGTVIDTYTFAATGHSWEVAHPPSIILNAGQSAQVTVWVTLPAQALPGAADTTTIAVTSTGDPSVSLSAALRTTVGVDMTYLYLPIIVR